MTILLPALAALAALCIWLTVKVVNRTETDWEYWTTVTVGLAILLVAASPVVCLYLAYRWFFDLIRNFWS